MERLLKGAVKAAIMACEMDEKLRGLGYSDTPYWNIYCTLSDSIYEFLGEKTNTYDESVTYNVLHTVSLMDDRRVALLMNEYRKNRPAQS